MGQFHPWQRKVSLSTQKQGDSGQPRTTLQPFGPTLISLRIFCPAKGNAIPQRLTDSLAFSHIYCKIEKAMARASLGRGSPSTQKPGPWVSLRNAIQEQCSSAVYFIISNNCCHPNGSSGQHFPLGSAFTVSQLGHEIITEPAQPGKSQAGPQGSIHSIPVLFISQYRNRLLFPLEAKESPWGR